MINVNAKFTSIEIMRYSRNEPVELKISFNDGKNNHVINKTTNLSNAEELASQIKSEAKEIVKKTNSDKGEGIFDGVVIVMFGDIDDEVDVNEKLSNSLKRIREDMRKMNSPASQGLLQRIASFKGSKYSI